MSNFDHRVYDEQTTPAHTLELFVIPVSTGNRCIEKELT